MIEAITEFKGRYSFLSNFYPLSFGYEGFRSWTAEHHFQAAKCVHPKDFLTIHMDPSPSAAKRMGRKIEIRSDWEDVKHGIMFAILREKFKVPGLRRNLLETGEALLVESNTWGDRYWGQCPLGVGQNILGKILMEIRLELQEQK